MVENHQGTKRIEITLKKKIIPVLNFLLSLNIKITIIICKRHTYRKFATLATTKLCETFQPITPPIADNIPEVNAS